MTSSPDSRRRVLDAVRASSRALSIEEISSATGLHANTVRGHVEVLLALGDLERTSAGAAGRGRPRWLYTAADPRLSPYRVLAEALVGQLADVDDPAVLQRAAERWATGLPEPRRAESPDEAVSMAVDALDKLGFTTEANVVGDTITISACPYADLTAGNTAICEIHAALLAQLLDQSGQDVVMTQLDIHPKPGVCVARLQRHDVVPVKTVHPKHAEPPTRPQGATA